MWFITWLILTNSNWKPPIWYCRKNDHRTPYISRYTYKELISRRMGLNNSYLNFVKNEILNIILMYVVLKFGKIQIYFRKHFHSIKKPLGNRAVAWKVVILHYQECFIVKRKHVRYFIELKNVHLIFLQGLTNWVKTKNSSWVWHDY